MKPVAAALISLVLLAPLSSAAAPYGGAPLRAARIEAAAAPGLSLGRPDLVQGVEGVAIHGTICRTPSHLATRAVGVRVQRLSADGRVLDDRLTRLAGVLGRRDRACGVYELRTSWTLAPGDSLRICADRRDGATCGPPAAAG